MHRIRQVGVIPLVGGTLAGAAVAATSGTNLALVAYSTPKAAYSQLIPAFQKTAAGKDVTFSQSYGASGDPEPARPARPQGRCRRCSPSTPTCSAS